MISGLIDGGQAVPQGSRHRVQRVSECPVTSAVSSPPYTPTECRQAAWGLSPRICTRSRVGAGSDPGHSACCGGRAGVQLCSHRRGSVGRGPGWPGQGQGQVPGAPRLQRASLFLLFFSFLNLVTRRNLPLRLRLERSSITFWGGGGKWSESDPDLPRLRPPPPQMGVGPQKGLSSSFSSTFSLGLIAPF